MSGSSANNFVITGSNFENNGQKPIVKIGEKVCVVSEYNNTFVKCLANPLGNGVFKLQLLVPGIGGSDISSELSEISSVLSMWYAYPSVGSLAGGTLLTILGNNFGTEKNDEIGRAHV